MKSRKALTLLSIGWFNFQPAQAFNWDHRLDGYVTRCFQASQIKVRCDDLSEPSWGIKERAELNIEAVDVNRSRYFYGYLKGIEGPLCRTHLRRIQKLLKNNLQACITGWGESTVSGETTAHWQTFETKSGKVSR